MSDLTVVIATRNRAPSLAGALLALTRQDYPQADLEVIVADNGSTDATPSVCETYAKVLPGLRLIRDPRPGQMVGWHRALVAAQGEVTAFIDDDVRPAPGWAASIRDGFADPDVGLATGPIVPDFEAPPPNWQRGMVLGRDGVVWSALWGSLDAGPTARDLAADFVWGSNFLARRRALLDVRGFHPAGMPAGLYHFTGDSDVAAGRRIAAAGWRCRYLPDAAVAHALGTARSGVDEIRRWITGEGIVTSYVTMRRLRARHPDLPSAELSPLVGAEMPEERIAAIGRGYLAGDVTLPEDIRNGFETAGPAGFRTHQAHFAADAAFRDWVLRADYLDIDTCYTHPDLKPATS